jgi:hypothetical protein
LAQDREDLGFAVSHPLHLNLLRYLAEKILRTQPLSFGGDYPKYQRLHRPLLNILIGLNGQNQMTLAETALTDIGVRLHKVPRLHSKVVAIDDDLLAIGSYNWMSADRHGKYARHETSFVYRGQHLETEISTIFQSLGVREK